MKMHKLIKVSVISICLTLISSSIASAQQRQEACRRPGNLMDNNPISRFMYPDIGTCRPGWKDSNVLEGVHFQGQYWWRKINPARKATTRRNSNQRRGNNNR